MMKYLTEVRLARVTIQERQAVSFAVPVELAIMIFWFLANRQARFLALMTWWLVEAAVKQYHILCDYLAGWQEDIALIRLAASRLIIDLLTIQVSRSFAFG